MDDLELERFARQLLLPEWGIEAQQRVLSTRVLLVGCGGLGTWIAQLLARAGVGHLTLADPDRVDRSNLHRQLFSSAAVGQFKSQALAQDLASFTDVRSVSAAIDQEWLAKQGQAFDLWIDASDRWVTRQQLGAESRRQGIPWILGSAISLSGHCAAFDPSQRGAACFDCVFGQQIDPGQTCEASGVLGPVVVTVASTQAQWALAHLSGMHRLPTGRLRRWDGALLTPSEFKFAKRPGCACSL